MKIIDSATDRVRRSMRHLAVFLNDKSNGKITPDAITWIGFIAHVPIAYFIAQDYLLLSAVLLIIFGLFDTLDGELARLQKVASPAGMVLDAATDRIKQMLVFAGISYNFLEQNYTNFEIILPIFALGMAISGAYLKAKMEVAIAVSKKIDHHKLNRMLTDGILQFEILISVIILALIVDQLLLACWVIAVLMGVSVIYRLIKIRKIIEDLT